FPAPRATFRSIVRNAAVLAEMPIQKILGKSRFRPEVRVRQAIVWVALRATKLSTADMGRRLGGRDHSTIIHARDQSEVFTNATRSSQRSVSAFGPPLRPSRSA